MTMRWQALRRTGMLPRGASITCLSRNSSRICSVCASRPSSFDTSAANRQVQHSIFQQYSSFGQRQRYSTSAASDASSSTQKACANCSTALPLSELACTSCGALQPLPATLDAYELLGLDVAGIDGNGWNVDLGELKTIWRKRVALSHPDRMGGKDHKEQQIAAQQSALINKAYETLREPLQRAHILLEKHSSNAPSESDSLEDPEVLMEVMELREGLEEASNEDEAEEVRQRNKVNLDQTIRELDEAFHAEPVDVEKAQKAAIGLRYWTNIDKAAREWQPGKPIELIH